MAMSSFPLVAIRSTTFSATRGAVVYFVLLTEISPFKWIQRFMVDEAGMSVRFRMVIRRVLIFRYR